MRRAQRRVPSCAPPHTRRLSPFRGWPRETKKPGAHRDISAEGPRRLTHAQDARGRRRAGRPHSASGGRPRSPAHKLAEVRQAAARTGDQRRYSRGSYVGLVRRLTRPAKHPQLLRPRCARLCRRAAAAAMYLRAVHLPGRPPPHERRRDMRHNSMGYLNRSRPISCRLAWL